MIDHYWLKNRDRLRKATSDWICELDPYALWTVGFKDKSRVASSKQSALASLKREVRQIALGVDERYHGTSYITSGVPHGQRFEALCFSEKRLSYPHVHVAFFDKLGHDEHLARSLFLLEQLPTSDVKLSPGDLDAIRAAGRAVVVDKGKHLVKRVSPHASSHVVTIHNTRGLGVYLTKEFFSDDPEPFEAFFFLSDFYSGRQLSAA